MIGFNFNDKAKAATDVAERQAAAMITEITKETEANIRHLIAETLRTNMSPYDMAEAIRDTIGLTSAQGQAALKYRRELVANGLSAAKVDDAVDKYTDELLDRRAETIARSEIMDALNTGQDEAWTQAQDEGLLSENATKVWIITPLEACNECVEMDGEEVPVGEEFPDGDPPLHPNCRCTIAIGKP